MSHELGLRERKKRQTRADLIRAAFELCVERGVDEVTVADIAAGANVSTRTFFNYFSSKEEALVGGTERAERFLERLTDRPDDEPLWDALRAAVVEVLDSGEEPQRDLLLQARLVHQSPALAQQRHASWVELEGALVAEVARRVQAAPTSLFPRLVVAAVVAGVHTAVDHWIDHPDEASLESVIDAALVALGTGLERTARSPARHEFAGRPDRNVGVGASWAPPVTDPHHTSHRPAAADPKEHL